MQAFVGVLDIRGTNGDELERPGSCAREFLEVKGWDLVRRYLRVGWYFGNINLLFCFGLVLLQGWGFWAVDDDGHDDEDEPA